MAWVTPSSRTTGTLITAAIWNQDNVANPTALYNAFGWWYLGNTVLGASGATWTVSGLPTSGYRHLKVLLMAKTDRASTVDTLYMRFNGVSTGTYYTLSDYTNNTPTSGGAKSAAATSIQPPLDTNATGTTWTFGGPNEIIIFDFLSSTLWKAGLWNGGFGYQTHQTSFRWENTAAITSLTFLPAIGTNVAAGSEVHLLGLKE